MTRAYTLAEIDQLRGIAREQVYKELGWVACGWADPNCAEAVRIRQLHATMIEDRVRTLMTGNVEP